MMWMAAGFLLLIYCGVSLLRRKFGVTLTPSLWMVIVLSLAVGGAVLVIPRVYAARADDARIESVLYITNAIGMGIMVCGTLLGFIAQAATEWGEGRRAAKVHSPKK